MKNEIRKDLEQLIKPLIELNGESCSWCANENNCTYNKKHMEYTREAVKNISYCTKAYCSCKCNCDYYVKDEDRYNQFHFGECAR